jgi:hypothetical protein
MMILFFTQLIMRLLFVGRHDKCFSFVSELIQDIFECFGAYCFLINLRDFMYLFSHLCNGHSLICSATMIIY